jgi:adenylate cyclase
MSKRARRGWLGKLGIGLVIGAAAAALAIALARTPFVEGIELMTYDWRMRLTAQPEAPSSDIVLVSIDDDSVRRMAPLVGRWPWPRFIHGFLIDYLSRAPAKAVAYDVLFTEPDLRAFSDGERETSGQESDEELVASVRKAGNVVVAGDVAAEKLIDETRALPSSGSRHLRTYAEIDGCIAPRDVFVPPFATLDEAAHSVGHTLMLRDDDGPLRRHHPFAKVGDQIIPSLAMATAMLVTGGSVRGAAGTTCPPLVAYRGPTVGERNRLTFNEHSFYTLFVSEQQILQGVTPEIDPAIFKDKIVVVSATASGTYEVQATPFGQGISGGEVHANIIDSLLTNRTIEPTAVTTAAGTTLFVAALVGGVGAAISVWPLAAVSTALVGALAWIAVRAFAGGTWLPLVMPGLAVGLAFVGQLAWQYFVEGREKRQVKRLFSRYVPRDVYEQLLADPDRAALGGKRRTMTVLFSDVRGFTAMSEKATPEEVVSQLNEYFSRMVDVLFAHRGTLDKFVGDMVMGLFGAPLDDPDHAEHAVQAALAMTRALDELNQQWSAAGRPVLDIGIGISTGDMVAGNIGSSAIMSYTVIGDTVNLGARLESLNKEYGTRVIISEATRSALKGRYDIRPLGEVTVKGKSRPVAIYEVKA